MPVKQPDPPKKHYDDNKHDDKIHEHTGADGHHPLAGQAQIYGQAPIQYTDMGEPIGRDYDHSPSGDAEQDPNPGVTKTQTEGIRRSIEIQRMGVDNWVRAHDDRYEGAVHESARGPWWDRAAEEAKEGNRAFEDERRQENNRPGNRPAVEHHRG